MGSGKSKVTPDPSDDECKLVLPFDAPSPPPPSLDNSDDLPVKSINLLGDTHLEFTPVSEEFQDTTEIDTSCN